MHPALVLSAAVLFKAEKNMKYNAVVNNEYICV